MVKNTELTQYTGSMGVIQIETTGRHRNNVIYLSQRKNNHLTVKGVQRMTETAVVQSVTDIEQRARQLLLECDEMSFPVDPVRIARCLGVDVRVATFTDDSISGAIVKKGNMATIYVNENDRPVRVRFTVAHELGHYVLHMTGKDASLIDRDMNLYRRVSGTYSSEKTRQEMEANRFAAALLMPAEVLKEQWVKSGKSISHLTRFFEVSTRALTYRLEELGLG